MHCVILEEEAFKRAAENPANFSDGKNRIYINETEIEHYDDMYQPFVISVDHHQTFIALIGDSDCDQEKKENIFPDHLGWEDRYTKGDLECGIRFLGSYVINMVGSKSVEISADKIEEEHIQITYVIER